MWSLAWFAVVYDSPAQHPRISETERNYLLKALPQDNATKGVSCPTLISIDANSLPGPLGPRIRRQMIDGKRTPLLGIYNMDKGFANTLP